MRQKSKMVAKLPEVPITLLVLQIHMSFQKQYRGLCVRTKHLYGQQLWPTLCRKSKMAANEPKVVISETMTYIVKVLMANLRHSTTANSQEVFLGDSNNERQSQMAAETGNTYIS